MEITNLLELLLRPGLSPPCLLLLSSNQLTGERKRGPKSRALGILEPGLAKKAGGYECRPE